MHLPPHQLLTFIMWERNEEPSRQSEHDKINLNNLGILTAVLATEVGREPYR